MELEAEVLSVPYCIEEVESAIEGQSNVRNPNNVITNLFFFLLKQKNMGTNCIFTCSV